MVHIENWVHGVPDIFESVNFDSEVADAVKLQKRVISKQGEADDQISGDMWSLEVVLRTSHRHRLYTQRVDNSNLDIRLYYMSYMSYMSYIFLHFT
jgi:hypothetical protein